jgi:hypothetical protein
MSGKAAGESPVQMDLRDVDHRVGQAVGGGQAWAKSRRVLCESSSTDG